MHLRNIALTAALALFSGALAMGSTSTGFGSATTDVNASGTYGGAVSFTIPNAALSIPTKQVRPGATFKVKIPVTNTTDHAITVTAGAVTAPANVTVTKTAPTADLAQGANGYVEYTLTFDADMAGAEALSGTTANFTFTLDATDTAATPSDLTVN